MVLWDEIGLCRKTFFQAPENCFFRTCLDCFRDSILLPSRLRSNTLTITLQEPLLQGILLSDSLSLLWLQRAGFSMGCSCGKTIFRALFFFRTALMTLRDARLSEEKKLFRPYFFSALFFETQRSPALQKNNFSGSKKLFFFSTLLF